MSAGRAQTDARGPHYWFRNKKRIDKKSKIFRMHPNGGVAQQVRACGSYPQCPGFKSLHRHHFYPRSLYVPIGTSPSFPDFFLICFLLMHMPPVRLLKNAICCVALHPWSLRRTLCTTHSSRFARLASHRIAPACSNPAFSTGRPHQENQTSDCY